MRAIIILVALLLSCTPREVLVPTPAQVEIRYLPAETSHIVDSTEVNVLRVHDTLSNTDTVTITKTRWQETVKEKRVIDSVPKYIVKTDTTIKRVPVPTAPWKFYALGILCFLFGSAIVYGVTRVFK